MTQKGNDIGAKGANILREFLKSNTTLISLNLESEKEIQQSRKQKKQSIYFLNR